MQKFITSKVCVLLILVFALTAFADDKKKPGKIEDFKMDSKVMARQMPYRVIFPYKYKQKDEKKLYPVIYLLHGLTGHFTNWTEKAKLSEIAAAFNYIIVMPEGNDGWYTDSATVPTDKYETHFIQEFIPEIDAKFRTIAKREGRIVAGLSMGGYGSLKYGLKYPQLFTLSGSFSGALMAPSLTEKMLGNGWKALTDSIMGVYGAEDSQTRKNNDIYRIVRELSPEGIKALPFLYVDCGTEDGLIVANREFTTLLLERKIPHEFRQRPGIHNWVFWESQVLELMQLGQRQLKAAELAKSAAPVKETK